MRTKASVAGHPLHPMLVAFPVALYTATVAALFAHVGTHDPFWYRVAFWTNLGGVVMAAIAAVPGLIDLVSLPAHTRARLTGLQHATFNVLALAMFVLSAAIIGRNWYAVDAVQLDDAAPLVLGLVGLASTVTAGVFGWTLVQTHHVGVKPTAHDVLVRSPEDVDDLDELAAPQPSRTPVSPAYRMHHGSSATHS